MPRRRMGVCGASSQVSARKVHSRGYCDDTVILADTLDDLRAMNTVVANFFRRHNFRVNEIKTKVTGRENSSAPLADLIHWPGSGNAFTTVPPGESIKYLGALVSMDLDWSQQIQKMRATILHITTCLTARRISPQPG